MSNQKLSQEEIAKMFKKANAQGFINHMVSAAGATAEQAAALFQKSDAKADQLLAKKASIREVLLEEVKSSEESSLPKNLKAAISK